MASINPFSRIDLKAAESMRNVREKFRPTLASPNTKPATNNSAAQTYQNEIKKLLSQGMPQIGKG